MVSESTQGQNMRPNRFSQIYIQKSTCSMNTVLFVNATIGFSENLFLVCISSPFKLKVTLPKTHLVGGS